MRLVQVAALAAAMLVAAPQVPAQEAASPAEVVVAVRAASDLLTREGEAALALVQNPNGPFVFKDSYVFAADCGRGLILAHPFQPARAGQPIAAGPTYGGVTAADREREQCAVGIRPGGGWWVYPFPKPGEAEPSRKVSFLMPVAGTSWIVGAGIHDETATVEDLARISAAP